MADYNLYDAVTGEYVPQKPVTMNFPEEFNEILGAELKKQADLNAELSAKDEQVFGEIVKAIKKDGAKFSIDTENNAEYNEEKGGKNYDRIRNFDRRTDSGIYEEISTVGRSGHNSGGENLLQKKGRPRQNTGRHVKSIKGTPTTIKGTKITYNKVDAADYGSVPRLVVEELKKFGFNGEVFAGEVLDNGNPLGIYDADAAAIGLKEIFIGCYVLDDPKGIAAHEAAHNHIMRNNAKAIAYHHAIENNVDENTKEAALFKAVIASNGYDADKDFIDELEAIFSEFLYTTRYGNVNSKNSRHIAKYKNMFKDFDAVVKAHDEYIDGADEGT